MSMLFSGFCLFDLLLNIHGKQLRSCRDGHLKGFEMLTTLFLDKPHSGSLPVFRAHSFAIN